jgi:dephospho-CoA kinase
MLIGITGTDGSGKGTVVEYLIAHYHFVHYSARGILVDELLRLDRETTRANMRLIANDMREKHGDDYIVTFNLARIEHNKTERAIIESIRTVAEAKTLKAHGGILLAVDADQALRYERVQSRRSESDKVSFEDFVMQEELETNDPNPHGMQKGKVMQTADYTIMNNGSVEQLHTQIETFLKNASITQ